MARFRVLVCIPTRDRTKFAAPRFPPTLGVGSRTVLVSAAPILANSFKEMKNVKNKSLGHARYIGFVRCCGCFPQCRTGSYIKECKPQAGCLWVQKHGRADWRRRGFRARAEPSAISTPGVLHPQGIGRGHL